MQREASRSILTGLALVFASIGSELLTTSLTLVGGIVFITWFSMGLTATALVFGFGLIGFIFCFYRCIYESILKFLVSSLLDNPSHLTLLFFILSVLFLNCSSSLGASSFGVSFGGSALTSSLASSVFGSSTFSGASSLSFLVSSSITVSSASDI